MVVACRVGLRLGLGFESALGAFEANINFQCFKLCFQVSSVSNLSVELQQLDPIVRVRLRVRAGRICRGGVGFV